LQQLTSSQLSDWWAFDMLQPSGSEIDNIRFGMVCATVMNAMTAVFWDRKKGKPPQFKPHDFFPTPQELEKKPQTVEDMAAKLKEIAGKLND
jgi:hypothetical protein